jgi:hypothetical protein
MILRSITKKSAEKRHWQSPENALRESGFLDFRVAGLTGLHRKSIGTAGFSVLATVHRGLGPLGSESPLTDPPDPLPPVLSVSFYLTLSVSLSQYLISFSLSGSLEQKDEEEEMKKKEEREKKRMT